MHSRFISSERRSQQNRPAQHPVRHWQQTIVSLSRTWLQLQLRFCGY
jgi:hypothetical protein